MEYPNPLQLKWEWPQQESPNMATWWLWQKAIKLVLCLHNWNLKQLLGKWLKHKSAKYQYSHQENKLYMQQEHGWT
eukprot:9816335-Ditylum_brightwellii.AAC.1